MKILLTGVHLTPALELIKQLKKDDSSWQISYIAHHQPRNTHIKNTLSTIVDSNKLFTIPSGKFNRHQPLQTIAGIPLTLIGIFKSYLVISRLQPNLVVSFGGYVSVPVVIAAWLKGIPSLTHEQTLTTSLSTKINRFFVKKIALSFDTQDQIRHLPKQKTVITGNLLRTDVLNKNTSPAFASLAKSKKPLLYITGGSQGSAIINQTVKKILPKISSRFNIIHQIGTIDLSHFQQIKNQYSNYHPVEYVGPDDLGWIFKQARLVVSRAGANTCQELAIRNKNCIIIPLPNTSQDEQTKNAVWLKSQVAHCQIIPQNQLTPATLYQSINNLLAKNNLTKTTKITQNKKLLDLIHDIV